MKYFLVDFSLLLILGSLTPTFLASMVTFSLQSLQNRLLLTIAANTVLSDPFSSERLPLLSAGSSILPTGLFRKGQVSGFGQARTSSLTTWYSAL